MQSCCTINVPETYSASLLPCAWLQQFPMMHTAAVSDLLIVLDSCHSSIAVSLGGELMLDFVLHHALADKCKISEACMGARD